MDIIKANIISSDGSWVYSQGKRATETAKLKHLHIKVNAYFIMCEAYG